MEFADNKGQEAQHAYVANNPIRAIDPTGKDSIQRNNAIAKAEEYVAKKEPGNQYQMGAKGKPGEKVDCSDLVSESVVAGGEKNPNYGNSGGGVKNIEKNTTKVSNEEVVKGNLVSFRSKSGYAYHIGIVKNIERNENGEITKVTIFIRLGEKVQMKLLLIQIFRKTQIFTDSINGISSLRPLLQ